MDGIHHTCVISLKRKTQCGVPSNWSVSNMSVHSWYQTWALVLPRQRQGGIITSHTSAQAKTKEERKWGCRAFPSNCPRLFHNLHTNLRGGQTLLRQLHNVLNNILSRVHVLEPLWTTNEKEDVGLGRRGGGYCEVVVCIQGTLWVKENLANTSFYMLRNCSPEEHCEHRASWSG